MFFTSIPIFLRRLVQPALLRTIRSATVLGVVLLAPSIEHAHADDAASSKKTETQSESVTGQNRVRFLIEQLGSDSYATRVRARESLQRIGLEAFDELHSAQYHDDFEIAMTARHLASSLLVSWSTETDPEEVRQTLHQYGAQSEDERLSRITRLADLPDRMAVAALVRLTRFETSLALSRVAALSLMQQQASDAAEVRTEIAKQIRSNLDHTDVEDNDLRVGRAPLEWLAAYADDLQSGRLDADRWRQLIAAQRRQIDTESAEQTTRASVLKLIRLAATRAWLNQQTDDALTLVSENLDLIPPTTRDLSEACAWIIQIGLYSVVLDLQNRHERIFEKQSMLLYSAAEATRVNGDLSKAEELARRAFDLNPLPKSETDRANMSPNAIAETAEMHRDNAQQLQKRGLFEWAEREYRTVIDQLDIVSLTSVRGRLLLAQMLAELDRHQDVVDVLAPLADRTQSDDEFRRRLYSVMMNFDRVLSDIAWHRALAEMEAGEVEAEEDKVGEIESGKLVKAKSLLKQAYSVSPGQENIDILISMYRLDSEDPQWSSEVKSLLESKLRDTQQLIDKIELLKRPGRRLRSDDALADALNQYAWLVANTTGDQQKALEYSKKSLTLSPSNPELLDTLARCYYASDQYEMAIQTQREAVRLMPHSPQILRQLKFFEAKSQERKH